MIDGYLRAEFGADGGGRDHPRHDRRLQGEADRREGRLSNRVIVRHLTVLHGIFKRAKRAYGLEPRTPPRPTSSSGPRSSTPASSTRYTGDEVELLAAARRRPRRTPRSTASPPTPAYGRASCWRCAGRTSTSSAACCTSVATTPTGGRRSPKGKRVRSVPMTPAVIDALGRLKERDHLTDDDDLVFCNTAGDHLDSWALRRRFYAAIENAGLRRIRFHDLRHASAPPRSGCSTRTRSRATWATSTTRPRSGTSTTSRGRRTRQALHEAFGGDVSPNVSRTETIPDELSATKHT